MNFFLETNCQSNIKKLEVVNRLFKFLNKN